MSQVKAQGSAANFEYPEIELTEERQYLPYVTATGGGRKDLLDGLSMPMLTVVTYNDTLKVFYQRLIKQGKAKLVAITAAIRKLLVIFNAMIKNNSVWKNA